MHGCGIRRGGFLRNAARGTPDTAAPDAPGIVSPGSSPGLIGQVQSGHRRAPTDVCEVKCGGHG